MTNQTAALQQHTPGPWRYLYDPQARYGRFESMAEGLPYNDPVVLAVRDDWNRYLDSPEGSANARLIAAAPEMLEALRMLIQEVDGGDDSLSMRVAQHTARAAIAKATHA